MTIGYRIIQRFRNDIDRSSLYQLSPAILRSPNKTVMYKNLSLVAFSSKSAPIDEVNPDDYAPHLQVEGPVSLCIKLPVWYKIEQCAILITKFYGLSTTEQYNSICDDDLDQLLQPIKEENPHIGYRSIQARLKVCGHFCQETRVREALVRLDPAAVAMRWCDVVQRRNFRVAGPKSLCHVDGNHKLIRYLLLFHL
ncbi:unnamed protein product [Mytilus edulis]|uniref:Uncharacterized protein n=1 Tax=Mytilus edulis TaxID=6550 RepID=A0A8S3R8N7_MYTED|nr:unnamed protein product [Mytilus edulis]